MSDAEGDLPGPIFKAVSEVGTQDGIVIDLSETDAGSKASAEVEIGRCAVGCPGRASVEEKSTGENGEGVAVECGAGFEVEDSTASAVEATWEIAP